MSSLSARPCWTILALLRAIVLIVCAVTVHSRVATAEAPSNRSGPHSTTPNSITTVNRDILALFDGTTEQSAAETRLHKWLEMPLNHLGYRVTYWDVSKGLPEAPAGRYQAIATWFVEPVPGAASYLTWAATVAAKGTKFIILDLVGGRDEGDDLALINKLLAHLGIEFADYFVSETARTTVAAHDATMVGHEIALNKIALEHQVVRVRSPTVRRHLVLKDPSHTAAKADSSAVVISGPGGGFASSGFAANYVDEVDGMRWVIDPIAFLTAALADDLRPIPDTTTAMGRRIYFSHIDGDAWNSLTEVDGYREIGAMSADVVLAELIRPYPDLPVTVGLIASDVDPKNGGHYRAAEIARRIFALPQVEVASHTHTHPYDWSFFKEYTREKELLRLIEKVDPKANLTDRSIASLIKYLREKAPEGSNPFESGSDNLPRARMAEPFDLGEEVAGSLKTANDLAPAGKTAKLYLWSGDTTPFEAAVRATRAAGVRNMNGGDARLDQKHPSLANIPPITKPVGAERQVYAAASNENTYTNDWTGPFDGFAMLHETITNTELPRRLKPFNIYYHMYSGSRPESLAAVRKNLELARASRVIPLAASRYAAIADFFHGIEIKRISMSAWTISNRGDLHTVRFATADWSVDAAESVGVLGANSHAGSLYVALDPSVAEARIALTNTGHGSVGPVIGGNGHIIDSRWQISELASEPCRISGKASGFGAGETNWGGLRSGGYRLITSTPGRGEEVSDDLQVGNDGRLKATLGLRGITGILFILECRDPATALAPMEPRPPRDATLDPTPAQLALRAKLPAAGTTKREPAAILNTQRDPGAAEIPASNAAAVNKQRLPVAKRTASAVAQTSAAPDQDGEPTRPKEVGKARRTNVALRSNSEVNAPEKIPGRQAGQAQRKPKADQPEATTNIFQLLQKAAQPQLLKTQ